MQLSPSVPALQVVNGHPTTLSTQVADYFGKNHQHVTRDIRNLIDKCPNLGLSNFGQTTYKDSQGKNQPCIEWTERDLSYWRWALLVNRH